MSSFNYLPKHDVKSQFIIFHFQMPLILSTHKRKQGIWDFLLPFQSLQKHFPLFILKLVSYHAHTENITAIFLSIFLMKIRNTQSPKLWVMQFASFPVHFFPSFYYSKCVSHQIKQSSFSSVYPSTYPSTCPWLTEGYDFASKQYN